MKKVYLALMCVAGFTMLTACGGSKPEKDAAEKENQEAVEENVQASENEDAQDATDVWSDPQSVEELDMNAFYEAGDFKPGATVIFEDNQAGEKAGELPSKWDVKSGSAEIAEAPGGKFITMSGGDSHLFPMVNNGSKAFLPEKFMTEFQFLFGKDVWYHVVFFDAEENEVVSVNFLPTTIDWNAQKKDEDWVNGNLDELDRSISKKKWNHFAVSYDSGNLKIFINGKRLANLPNIKPVGHFLINAQDADGKSHYLKNIRVTK